MHHASEYERNALHVKPFLPHRTCLRLAGERLIQLVCTIRAVSSQFDALGEIPPRENKIEYIFFYYYCFQTPVSCHIQLVFHSNATNL